MEPGENLGSYRIERMLGRGGMGAVYLAYDATLRRPVALKLIPGSSEGAIARGLLLREARNAAALSHPNIGTIYEVGEAGGSAFIAMEYVEGRPLSDRLSAGALPAGEAIQYALQAADALAYAHEHGVIHRDFKAANVIVNDRGHLKIVDFGLARRCDVSLPDATTMETVAPLGTPAGTPYAMAPEQVRGEATDARTDIWSLGVLLCEMFGGGPPFVGATHADLFSSILRDPPRALPGQVPAELTSVIARCLEKAPERRYQRAGDVRAALEAIRPGAGAARSATAAITRRSWLLAGALLLAFAVVVGGIIFARRIVPASRTPDAVPVRLAVLPLRNLTADPEQDAFTDGLTEDIVTSLARLQSDRLSVIASASSSVYKRSEKSLQEIGGELGAGAILRGTVARSRDRMTVVTELVQPSSGRRLWGRTYERSAVDLVTLQREIAGEVAKTLGVGAATAERPGSTKTTTPNPEAYELYLRGLSHVVRQSEPDIDQAIALFEKSAAIDPMFVPVQAFLALSYGNKASTYRPDDPQWEEKGFAAAQKALQLDPEAAEAHYAKAMMLWRPSHGFPSREALAELRMAVAARPDFDDAWAERATILLHVGHMAASVRDVERALQINPGNVLARFRYGPIYDYEQRYEDALAALDRVPREAFPVQWSYHRAWALLSLGRLDEAGRVIEDGLKDIPADQGGELHAVRGMLLAKHGDRAGAEAAIADAVRIGRNFIHFHHTAYTIAATYATLGDLDKAQEWIETAANDGFPNYAMFEIDVHLERLRATPRFRALLARLRSEWEHIPGEPD